MMESFGVGNFRGRSLWDAVDSARAGYENFPAQIGYANPCFIRQPGFCESGWAII